MSKQQGHFETLINGKICVSRREILSDSQSPLCPAASTAAGFCPFTT